MSCKTPSWLKTQAVTQQAREKELFLIYYSIENYGYNNFKHNTLINHNRRMILIYEKILVMIMR